MTFHLPLLTSGAVRCDRLFPQENPAVLKDRSTKEDVFYLLGTLVHK